MDWQEVGDWIKDNAGSGAALVGSLITGNVPGAVAAGVAMVQSATGQTDAGSAMAALNSDPKTVAKLRELYYQEQDSVRKHIEQMERIKLDAFKAGQETIKAGDKAEDKFVRRTRPAQSWLSLSAAIAYVFTASNVDQYVLGALLALPLAYAGLRQVGKGIDSVAEIKKPR